MKNVDEILTLMKSGSSEYHKHFLAQLFYSGNRALQVKAVQEMNEKDHGPLLVQIAKGNKDWLLQLEAVRKLSPEEYATTLFEIAMESDNFRVRREVIRKLDPSQHRILLKGIRDEETHESVRLELMRKLNPDLYSHFLYNQNQSRP